MPCGTFSLHWRRPTVAKSWQRLWIALARNSRLATWVERQSVFAKVAQRFVAGQFPLDAWRALAGSNRRGFSVSFYYLGEYVTDEEQIALNTARIRDMVRFLVQATPEAHVSVDPTQVGSQLSADLCWQNALSIAEAFSAEGSAKRRTLMLDMEDRSWVEPTLRLHRDLRDRHVPVGITVQAYLHRTEQDVKELISGGDTVIRLVKGAFAEPPEWAWLTRDAVRQSYLRLARLLLSPEAQAQRIRPVFGTHDTELIQAVTRMALENGWGEASWEIEMLLGVRTPLQEALREAGHLVRLYVPFGTEWWPYVARRIGENPRNALLIARSLTSPAAAKSGTRAWPSSRS